MQSNKFSKIIQANQTGYPYKYVQKRTICNQIILAKQIRANQTIYLCKSVQKKKACKSNNSSQKNSNKSGNSPNPNKFKQVRPCLEKNKWTFKRNIYSVSSKKKKASKECELSSKVEKHWMPTIVLVFILSRSSDHDY